MIGLQISLQYLIPLALEALKKNFFAECDFFEGDLLKQVLAIHTEYWNNNQNYWATLDNLIKDRRNEIENLKFGTSNFDNDIHQH